MIMRYYKSVIVSVMILSLTLITYDIEAKTGNDWKKMPKLARDAYIWGFLDTWQNIEEFMVEDKRLQAQNPLMLHYTNILNCIREKASNGQLSAIVEKYIKNNPESLHYNMPNLVLFAIHNTCEPKSR